MKILTILSLLFLSTMTYGQDSYEPDPRIISNFGESKTKELVKYRPNLYNYYVYQLNHTCMIVEKGQETKNAKISKGKFTNASNAKLTKSDLDVEYFNYKEWGIEPDTEITKYYKLSDGSILKVLSVRALTNKFRVSPKNTKSLY